MNTPLREQLSRHTIEKLNALRTLKPHTIKVLGILFKNAIDTVEHVDIYQSREKTYGEEYADKIVEIRMMSKLQLLALSEKLEYVKGFKSDYFKKKGSLTKQDWLNMKLYVYVMNRLVWSN